MTKVTIKALSSVVLAAACALELRAVNEEGYTFRDYKQEGLVAHWDAKNYCGEGISGDGYSGKYWNDLVDGRKLAMVGDSYSSELGCHRAVGGAYYGVLCGGTTDFLNPSADGVTVEIAVTMDKYTPTPLFIGPKATGIGIEYSYTNPSGWILGNDNIPERVAYNPRITRNYDRMPQFWVLSVCYTNGIPCLDHVYLNGQNPTTNGNINSDDKAKASLRQLYVMANAGTGSNWSACRIHAIRVYRGKLTAAEAEANRQLDIKRYCQEDYYAENRLFYSFKVKSGSVTVGSDAYAAGDFVYYRNDIAVPVAADNAVIVPRQDGASEISLVSGALKIEVEDESAMTYVKSLALGADAVLNVPAKGLNAATLTAEAGATATGSGMLVSTAAACPVAYANYLAANYVWTGWPAGGTAYVPVGANLAMTATEAAALDGIVFLDDGTSAAKATKVSCADAAALTFHASVAGPGIVSFANAQALTITGDSRHFTGNFAISNTVTWVRNEYGLGGPASRMADVRTANDLGIHFDNGTSVFTCRAPIKIGSYTSDKEVLKSESAEKKLVFAENVERVNYNLVVGGTMRFYGNVVFNKWYATSGTNYSPQLIDENGTLEFAGPVWLGQGDLYLSSHNGPVTYSGMIVEANLFSPPSLAFGGKHVCARAASLTAFGTKFCIFGDQTYTLNGCDQDFSYLYVAGSNAKGSFVSDLPAQVRVVGASSQTISPVFMGAAGFTHAAGDAVTTTLSGMSGSRISTTTGLLEVDSGTLELCDGYRWLGTNVTVTGGALVLSDSAPFARKTVMRVTDTTGASVKLPNGGNVPVRAFMRNGVWMPAGTYGGEAALTAGKIDVAHCLSCFDAESSGVLEVKHNSDRPSGFMFIFR